MEQLILIYVLKLFFDT